MTPFATAASSLAGKPLSHPPLSLAQTAQFFEMLRALLGAGVPLARALDGLSEQPELSLALHHTVRALESGHSLSRAFALGGFSDPVVIGLLQLGERTGTLDKVVEELANSFRWRAQLMGELRSRLTYPIILATACALLVGLGPPFLLSPVLEFLTQSGAPLPWATRALLGFVSLLSSPLFWLALALAVLIGVQVLVLASRRGSALRFEGWLMRTPRLGRCASDFYSLRFGRALLSGLASGYPLLGAVDLAARCCGSATIEQQARAVTAAMVAGQTPEQAFGQMVALDPVLARCIPLGLSLGQVEPLLGAGLRLGEERLRCSVEAFLALLEPILLAFMGGLVALCVLATVSPMLSLLQGVL